MNKSINSSGSKKSGSPQSLKKNEEGLNSDAQKDEVIEELKDTIQIMEDKIKKLETLVKQKDTKIDSLKKTLEELGIN